MTHYSLNGRPDFKRAKQYALHRLERELSPVLVYHCLEHSRDEVMKAAERIALLEGVTDESDLLLLRTAVLYHDLGYVVSFSDHEANSARMAAEVLPAFGYQSEQIEVICGLILATKLPQSPQTMLEQIIADADLDVLGRRDFFERNFALLVELEGLGIIIPVEQWQSDQLKFLLGHRYFTKAANDLRSAGKQKNIVRLQKLLLEAGIAVP